MGDETALGQRELTAESEIAEFTQEELALIGNNAAQILIEIVRATNKKTINAALGELSDFTANWLKKLEEDKEKAGEEGKGDEDEDAGEDA